MGDERETLAVWLENKKVVQSPGAEASLPICPPLGRLCPTFFLGLWPALCKAQAPGREDRCTEVVGGFLL